MIPGILISLIPVLVSLAEKEFGGSGQGTQKKEWVVGMVDDIFVLLEKRSNLPDWFKQSEPLVKTLVDELIEKAVEALEK